MNYNCNVNSNNNQNILIKGDIERVILIKMLPLLFFTKIFFKQTTCIDLRRIPQACDNTKV